MPSRRAMAAWLGTSPASSWRRHSMALRNVSTIRGGPIGLGGRALRRDGGTTLTTWPGGTRRVRAPTPLVRKVGFGPRAISTVCSRYEGGCGADRSSKATWTIRKTTSGSGHRGRRETSLPLETRPPGLALAMLTARFTVPCLSPGARVRILLHSGRYQIGSVSGDRRVYMIS
jgi:hypothetical protein